MQEILSQLYGYLHGMWRYRWSAILIAWGVSVVGWLVVLSLPNQYTASAVIYVDTTSIMKPLLKGLAVEYDTNDELRVMSRVLLSRENLLSVIRETDMDLGIDTPQQREQLLDRLSRAIEIQGGGGRRRDRSNIYEISYVGNSPEQVYKVVSNLLNNMIENTLNSSRTDTVAAQKFLDTQIAEYEKRLSEAEQRLADFKKANVGYMPDEKGNYYARLQRAQDAVEQTRAELRLATQRYRELQKQLSGEQPLLDSNTYQASTAVKLRQYEERLKELLNQFTEQHPDVRALRAIIADIKAGKDVGQIESFGGSDEEKDVGFNPVYQELKVELSKASVEVQLLRTRLADNERTVKELKDSIDIIPEVEAQLSKLNRDYDITKGRYLSLVERRESARLAQDAGQSTSEVKFRVIEPPITPVRPSGPNRLLLLMGVLVASLGAGAGWAMLRYLLRPSYISLQGVSKIVGMPILGSVSLYMSPEHRHRRKQQFITFVASAMLLVVVSLVLLVFRDSGAAAVGSLFSGPGA